MRQSFSFLSTQSNLHVPCPVRLLLGVQSLSPPPGFLVAPCGSTGLADWELDRLMWSRSVENIATATTTITSLAQLLDQIGNIVINDNIAQQVRWRCFSSYAFAPCSKIVHVRRFLNTSYLWFWRFMSLFWFLSLNLKLSYVTLFCC